jgi:hypothetical protein
VGRHAIAAIAAHPDLELVGARVYSAEKAGQAIHAIPHVCAAAPGIRTFLDLPMITGRGAIDSRPGLLG